MSKDSDRPTTHLWSVIQAWLDVLPYQPSQNRLGAKVGVSGSAVTDWKYGDAYPSPENLEALAAEMETVAGPDIYAKLLDATFRDKGYDPDRGKRRAGD